MLIPQKRGREPPTARVRVGWSSACHYDVRAAPEIWLRCHKVLRTLDGLHFCQRLIPVPENAVTFSSARTTNRFPSSRWASAIQIVLPLESTPETQPQLQPACYLGSPSCGGADSLPSVVVCSESPLSAWKTSGPSSRHASGDCLSSSKTWLSSL